MKVQQARLPKAAYNGLTTGIEYYAAKDSKKCTKYCPVHPQRMIDDKYDVCYHCFIKKNE